MNAQNAYELAATKRKRMKLWSCVETPSKFVFAFVPRNYVPDTAPMFGLIAIDKKTGEESYFNPIDLPPNERLHCKKLDISIFE